MATTDLLRRSDDGAVVAGVCAGIAQHYRIDPLLVRVAAVLIALSSGLGIVLYAAAWLLLPRGADAPALVRVFPPVARVRSRTWTVLVCAAALVVLLLVGFAFSASLLPTMVVLGILYAAQLRPGTKPGGTPVDARAPGTSPAPAAWPLLASPPGELLVTTPAGPWKPTNRWGQPLAAEECAAFYAVPDPVGLYGRTASTGLVRRSRLVALVAGLTVAAVFAMLSLLGAFVLVPPVTYLAVGLIGVGAALIVGAFVGRPTGFLVLAVALVLLAAVGATLWAGAARRRA
ncbi:MAG TPA: PspC domain-containing protein [Propionibacteriaceae bacterium]|nr:PspC domain-containing protein [Propionibacteriaceae bacterium]